MAGDVGVLRLVALDASPEAAYGTAAPTPDKSWPWEGDPPSVALETVNNAGAYTGVYEEGTQTVIVGKRVDWAPSYEANMDNIAFFLRAIMGTIAAPSGTNPYTHTITVTQADSPSFTLYGRGPKTASGKLEQYTGCKVSQLALSLTAGGKVTLRPTWIGSGVHTEQTATAPALNTDSILSGAQVSAFTVNAVNYLTQLRDFEMTLDRKLDAAAEKVAGTVTLPSLNSQGFTIAGRFTLNDEENDLAGIAALAEAKTLVPIVLTLTLATHSATITIYKAELDSPGETGGKGKVNRSVSFVGKYSIGDSKAINAVVINGTAAYS